MIKRNPAVAGLFYPKEPEELEKTVEALLKTGDANDGMKNEEDKGEESREEKKKNGKEKEKNVFGVISPHAGYIYSGKIAGKVFSQVVVPRNVVILCPNHTGYGAHVSLFPKGMWLFPGFSVKISDAINDFLSRYDIFEEDTGAHFREHSAEVIVPFLYFKNRSVEISVVCIRTLELDILKKIGECLHNLKKEIGKDLLIVASSDMNHYEPDDISRKKDKIAIDRIANIDPDGLLEVVLERNITMCGVAPATSLLTSAKLHGIKKAELVAYGNSAEVSGDYSSVVGYAGIIIP